MTLSNADVKRMNWDVDTKTSKQRLAALIAMGVGKWICGTAFLEIYEPTYSQRIGELIKDGEPIERGRCDDVAHNHRGSMGAYRAVPVRKLRLKKKCWHTGSYRSHDQGCYEYREEYA